MRRRGSRGIDVRDTVFPAPFRDSGSRAQKNVRCIRGTSERTGVIRWNQRVGAWWESGWLERVGKEKTENNDGIEHGKRRKGGEGILQSWQRRKVFLKVSMAAKKKRVENIYIYIYIYIYVDRERERERENGSGANLSLGQVFRYL